MHVCSDCHSSPLLTVLVVIHYTHALAAQTLVIIIYTNSMLMSRCMHGGVHHFVNSPSSSTDAAIVGSLMAIIVFLLLSLFVLMAITTALVMMLRAKQKQCTCKGESIIYMHACLV